MGKSILMPGHDNRKANVLVVRRWYRACGVDGAQAKKLFHATNALSECHEALQAVVDRAGGNGSAVRQVIEAIDHVMNGWKREPQ